MFSKLKLSIGLSRLRKHSKNTVRKKMVHNLESARSIGIICFATTNNGLDNAMHFANFLNEKKIITSILVFCPLKEVPQNFLLRKNVKVFTKKELNWYGRPNQPIVEQFINEDFDILIDLSLQEIFPLRWVSTLSQAKFKVGTLGYFGNPNDLTISLKNEKSEEYLISQIKHYLNLINNRFAQEQDWAKEETK